LITAGRVIYMSGLADEFNNPVTVMDNDAKTRERRKRLAAAARRALAEAEDRRAATQQPRPQETGGPAGPEPTRYGDWERKGIASDF
jgi:hypothetical protein